MKRVIFILIYLSISFFTYCQKIPLDFSVYDDWENIENQRISNDGQWICYEKNPQYGDGELFITSNDNKKVWSLERGCSAIISPNSDYVVFKIKPQTDTLRALKLEKTDDDKLPKDSLVIFSLKTEESKKYDRVKSYKVPDESSWMAFLYHKAVEVKDTSKDESKKKEKKKGEGVPETSEFVIINPNENLFFKYDSVSEYSISENGKLVNFIRVTGDSLLTSTIYSFNTESQKLDSLSGKEGISKKIETSNNGEYYTFLHTQDSVKNKIYSIYCVKLRKGEQKLIMDTITNAPFKGWSVSENGRVYFSDDDSKLYFGTAPIPKTEPKDTLLEEEKVHVDIWNWKDPLLQPQQLAELKDEKKRTYLAVYHIKEDKIVQLADTNIRQIRTVQKGNLNIALGFNDVKYQKRTSWDAQLYRDVYLINLLTGDKDLLFERNKSGIGLSPGGNYIYWYEQADSNWYSYSISQKQKFCLTKDINVNLFDEDHDYPEDPSSYGNVGWTTNDESFLIYDRYDIWKLQPEAKVKPENVTKGYGRENKISFRYQKLDDDAFFVDPDQEMILSSFNESTKQSGFYKTELKSKSVPVTLISGDYAYYGLTKAKNSVDVIWRKMSYNEYPDIWISSLNFKKPVKLTAANPQQEKYNWGTVELFKWVDANGNDTEGLLYKPENFDPTKKYPMIVYFYRLHSDELHQHYTPRPSRSVINPTFYTSNDYLVFMPNIRYKIGYPGESSVNAVVSGTLAVINKGFVDKEHIGIQGQSWGGYQVAYIVTKTDLFAAASPGAPVSNMTSAYGGIRWQSGMSRMFQYEQTQSRIGGTLWDKPFQYIENSPVFFAPKINTPMLIRHDDNDGAVPWYQGIELFVALRRLNKPSWLINYNGAPHNLTEKRANQKDWSKRMFQFFNYYLKDEKPPVWLEEGIPAVEKGENFGFDLVE